MFFYKEGECKIEDFGNKYDFSETLLELYTYEETDHMIIQNISNRVSYMCVELCNGDIAQLLQNFSSNKIIISIILQVIFTLENIKFHLANTFRHGDFSLQTDSRCVVL